MNNTQIPRCLTCKYWNNTTNYEGDFNLGVCSQLHNNELVTIELQTGWDGGYVKEITTDQKFGCVSHETK